MVDVLNGSLDARGRRFAVVAARFNAFITGPLVQGALAALRAHGAGERDVRIVWVPGAFELPVTARRIARAGGVNAVICLGAVIRGETPHFQHVAEQTAAGLAETALTTEIPVIFGVLTTDTVEQAMERAGLAEGAHPFDNKGYEAALSAIEMAGVFARL